MRGPAYSIFDADYETPEATAMPVNRLNPEPYILPTQKHLKGYVW